MGSLTSRPKSTPAPVIVSSPVETTTTTASTVTPPIEPSPEEIAKTRAENVLRRSRSSLGTIITSFRGVLTRNDVAPQRKSLLGE